MPRRKGRLSAGSRTLLLAATRGKDVPGILRVLLPGFERIMCTRYMSNPRAMDAAELCEIARRVGREKNCVNADRIHWSVDLATAWRTVQQQNPPADLICVAGSFFIAAEARAMLQDLVACGTSMSS